MEYVRESLPGFKIFDSMIRENVSLTEAQSAQMDIFSYAPDSNGAKDYYKLAEELLQN